MIAGKVYASISVSALVSVMLWLLYGTNLAATTRIECIPLKLCPLAMKLIRTKPYAPETLEFLRYSHCGFDDNREPKIWCTMFLFCKTPDSRNGICTKVEECEPLMNYMENVDRQDPIVKKYLREYRCSTEHDPEIKVCCPEELKAIEKKKKEVHERFSVNLPDANTGECGKQNIDDKIIGGTETALGEYPWMVLFKYVNKNKVQYACGGSLINQQYVVTAAHCVDPDIVKQKGLGKLQSLILGEYDIRNETDCIYHRFGKDCAEPVQEFRPQDYSTHPDYNSQSMINDIAVIKLDRKVKFSDYVQPICLPSHDFTLNGNETFTISGWGRTENEKRSSVKRKASLKFSFRARCNQYDRRRQLTSGQICVGDGKGVDSCYGDSGGPLMIEQKTKNGFATFIVGLVSYGYGQICGSFPGVYTFIPNYLNWIYEQIN